jgi:cation/acetate symporter
VAFLVALAFAVAASANVPVILFSIYWRRFNTTGACCGLLFGLVGSIVLIFVGPSVMGIDPPTMLTGRHAIQHLPIFPLENPGILSVPIGFIGAILGTLLGAKDENAVQRFEELEVRATTGLGAEKAVAGH